MSNIDLRNITNSFRDVRLGSLSSWSRANEFIPHDLGGPYVVTQEGYDPEDPKLTPDEFILHRSGAWLSLSFFFQMSEPDRAEFVFRTAAEVMQVMSGLPSKVQIIRTGADEKAAPAMAEAEEMAAVLQKEKDISSTKGSLTLRYATQPGGAVSPPDFNFTLPLPAENK